MLDAGGHPGSLRKNQDRTPARRGGDGIVPKFAQRANARGPVDGNAARLAEIPAKKRQAQQFALQHEDRRVEKQRQNHRFPCRLMLGGIDHLAAGLKIA